MAVVLTVFFGKFIETDLNIIHSSDALPANWTDVPYANESPSEKMDIYVPNTTGPHPVVIWIHGGRYLVGDKNNINQNFTEEALKRGYAVVSINYRLATEAKYPAQIYDVKVAIRFLRTNSKTYNLNPDKFAISGSSAGGGLAALAGTSANVPELQNDSLGYGNASNRVQAVVDLKGPINFSTFMSQLLDMNKTHDIGQSYDESKTMLDKLFGSDNLTSNQQIISNPVSYLSPDDPPFLIEHGTADTTVPQQQSIDFANELQKVLGKDKVTLILAPGVDHSYSFGSQNDVNIIMNFLDKNLKN